jgi:DHA1 family tetracycline resistance protein-like MFS transporter
MTQRTPQDAQGELQGGVASVMALANVGGPLLMTQTFAWFTAPDAPVYFPGAAFVVAALINLTAFAVLMSLEVRRAPSATRVAQ